LNGYGAHSNPPQADFLSRWQYAGIAAYAEGKWQGKSALGTIVLIARRETRFDDKTATEAN